MWQQVARGDIDKARERIGFHLAETLKRQEQEMRSLRAKHQDELQLLEAKQADLNTLEAMLDRFADDFQSAPKIGMAPDQESPQVRLVSSLG